MITYKEITVLELDKYGKIPFTYISNQKYEIEKINRGLGGFKLNLINLEEPYFKDFGSRVDNWKDLFDLSNWKFFVAIDNNKYVGGCVVATKTDNCHMLENRNDIAVLWDIRVIQEYKHQGIGQHLFDMAKSFAIENGFKKIKIECQNTNVPAMNFYHKQGCVLGCINEYAYKEYPLETQIIWYLDLKNN